MAKQDGNYDTGFEALGANCKKEKVLLEDIESVHSAMTQVGSSGSHNNKNNKKEKEISGVENCRTKAKVPDESSASNIIDIFDVRRTGAILTGHSSDSDTEIGDMKHKTVKETTITQKTSRRGTIERKKVTTIEVHRRMDRSITNNKRKSTKKIKNQLNKIGRQSPVRKEKPLERFEHLVQSTMYKDFKPFTNIKVPKSSKNSRTFVNSGRIDDIQENRNLKTAEIEKSSSSLPEGKKKSTEQHKNQCHVPLENKKAQNFRFKTENDFKPVTKVEDSYLVEDIDNENDARPCKSLEENDSEQSEFEIYTLDDDESIDMNISDSSEVVTPKSTEVIKEKKEYSQFGAANFPDTNNRGVAKSPLFADNSDTGCRQQIELKGEKAQETEETRGELSAHCLEIIVLSDSDEEDNSAEAKKIEEKFSKENAQISRQEKIAKAIECRNNDEINDFNNSANKRNTSASTPRFVVAENGVSRDLIEKGYYNNISLVKTASEQCFDSQKSVDVKIEKEKTNFVDKRINDQQECAKEKETGEKKSDKQLRNATPYTQTLSGEKGKKRSPIEEKRKRRERRSSEETQTADEKIIDNECRFPEENRSANVNHQGNRNTNENQCPQRNQNTRENRFADKKLIHNENRFYKENRFAHENRTANEEQIVDENQFAPENQFEEENRSTDINDSSNIGSSAIEPEKEKKYSEFGVINDTISNNTGFVKSQLFAAELDTERRHKIALKEEDRIEEIEEIIILSDSDEDDDLSHKRSLQKELFGKNRENFTENPTDIKEPEVYNKAYNKEDPQLSHQEKPALQFSEVKVSTECTNNNEKNYSNKLGEEEVQKQNCSVSGPRFVIEENGGYIDRVETACITGNNYQSKPIFDREIENENIFTTTREEQKSQSEKILHKRPLDRLFYERKLRDEKRLRIDKKSQNEDHCSEGEEAYDEQPVDEKHHHENESSKGKSSSEDRYNEVETSHDKGDDLLRLLSDEPDFDENRSSKEKQVDEENRLREETRLRDEKIIRDMERIHNGTECHDEKMPEEISVFDEKRPLKEKQSVEENRFAQEKQPVKESEFFEEKQPAKQSRFSEEEKTANERRVFEGKRPVEERQLSGPKPFSEDWQYAKERRLSDENESCEQQRSAKKRRFSEENQRTKESRPSQDKRSADEKRSAEAKKPAENKRSAEENRVAENRRSYDEKEFLGFDSPQIAYRTFVPTRTFGESRFPENKRSSHHVDTKSPDRLSTSDRENLEKEENGSKSLEHDDEERENRYRNVKKHGQIKKAVPIIEAPFLPKGDQRAFCSNIINRNKPINENKVNETSSSTSHTSYLRTLPEERENIKAFRRKQLRKIAEPQKKLTSKKSATIPIEVSKTDDDFSGKRVTALSPKVTEDREYFRLSQPLKKHADKKPENIERSPIRNETDSKTNTRDLNSDDEAIDNSEESENEDESQNLKRQVANMKIAENIEPEANIGQSEALNLKRRKDLATKTQKSAGFSKIVKHVFFDDKATVIHEFESEPEHKIKNTDDEFDIEPESKMRKFETKDTPSWPKPMKDSNENRRTNSDSTYNKIYPKLEEFLAHIFGWHPKWLGEQIGVKAPPPIVDENKLTPMLPCYRTYEEYYKIAEPLLTLEMWYGISRDYKEGKTPLTYFSIVPNSIDVIEIYFTDVKVSTLILEVVVSRRDLQLQDHPVIGDLLFLEYYSNNKNKNSCKEVFAYVKSLRKTPITSLTNLNRDLINAAKEPHMLLTYTVMTKALDWTDVQTNRINIMRTISYLRSNMRMVQALQNFPKSPLMNKILHPNVEDYQLPPANNVEAYPLVTKDSLNTKQLEAVVKITEAVVQKLPKVCLIQGPPGTGKSKVIVNLVTQILYGDNRYHSDEKLRILVCAPSNAAVDELVLRLLEVRKTFAEENRFSVVRTGRIETIHPSAKIVSLRELAKKRVDERGSLYPSMSINDIRNKPGEENSRHITTMYREAEEDLLKGADVIASTLTSCYTNQMESNFRVNAEPISVCIVDEATQSVEPENLIPLMLGVKTLVLVGDTNQLPATVLSQRAKQFGLDQSLFARIWRVFEGKANNPIIQLDTQYRMTLPVAHFPNKYFYGGALINAAKMHKLPFHFYRVINLDSTQDIKKFTNDHEADFVANLIYTMIARTNYDNAILPVKVGIITPYNDQKTLLTERINERISRLKDKDKIVYEVNTVDSFQGQERDVIIMSCVRSNGIGFLSDRQRLCVALTRAKHSLILCGNFRTFQRDPMWEALLSDAQKRNVYINVKSNANPGEIRSHIIR